MYAKSCLALPLVGACLSNFIAIPDPVMVTPFALSSESFSLPTKMKWQMGYQNTYSESMQYVCEWNPRCCLLCSFSNINKSCNSTKKESGDNDYCMRAFCQSASPLNTSTTVEQWYCIESCTFSQLTTYHITPGCHCLSRQLHHLVYILSTSRFSVKIVHVVILQSGGWI